MEIQVFRPFASEAVSRYYLEGLWGQFRCPKRSKIEPWTLLGPLGGLVCASWGPLADIVGASWGVLGRLRTSWSCLFFIPFAMGFHGKSFLALFAMEFHGKCGSGHSATYCLPVCHGNSSRHGLPWDLHGKPFKNHSFSAFRSYMRLPWDSMANRPHPHRAANRPAKSTPGQKEKKQKKELSFGVVQLQSA